jgi:hypothetical protein
MSRVAAGGDQLCGACEEVLTDGFCRSCDTLELAPDGLRGHDVPMRRARAARPRARRRVDQPTVVSRMAVSLTGWALVATLAAVLLIVAAELGQTRADLSKREEQIASMLYSSRRMPTVHLARSLHRRNA